MTVFEGFLNTTISAIERKQETGPGGDFTMVTLLESSAAAPIRALRQPFNAFATAGDRVVRDIDSVLIEADNSFFLDLGVLPDTVRTVRAGDLLTWASETSGGPTGTRDEILRLNIWDVPSELFERGHVELFTRGQGAP